MKKFLDFTQVSEESLDYVFELELLAAGITGFTNTFPKVYLLGGLSLIRRSDHYLVEGLIPLSVFEIVYPEWEGSIIPGGKRGPVGLVNNTIYFTSEWKQVIAQDKYDEISKLFHADPVILAKFHPITASVEPSQVGKGYIKGCEIYTVEGLRCFISTIKLDQVLNA
jgi:hypothetical protein